MLLKLTQEQLGARLGWSQERISTLENGKYGLPSLPQLALLAEALELPLTDLIKACGYDEVPAPPPAIGGDIVAAYRRSCVEMVQTIGRIHDGAADAHRRLERIQDEMHRAERMSERTHAQMRAKLQSPGTQT